MYQLFTSTVQRGHIWFPHRVHTRLRHSHSASRVPPSSLGAKLVDAVQRVLQQLSRFAPQRRLLQRRLLTGTQVKLIDVTERRLQCNFPMTIKFVQNPAYISHVASHSSPTFRPGPLRYWFRAVEASGLTPERHLWRRKFPIAAGNSASLC